MREIGGRWHLSISGRLRAADLRRMERACGEALQHRPLPLDLHLDALNGIDLAAALFLHHLLAGGAAIVGRSAADWQARLAAGQP
jgi:hypothetical protein